MVRLPKWKQSLTKCRMTCSIRAFQQTPEIFDTSLHPSTQRSTVRRRSKYPWSPKHQNGKRCGWIPAQSEMASVLGGLLVDLVLNTDCKWQARAGILLGLLLGLPEHQRSGQLPQNQLKSMTYLDQPPLTLVAGCNTRLKLAASGSLISLIESRTRVSHHGAAAPEAYLSAHGAMQLPTHPFHPVKQSGHTLEFEVHGTVKACKRHIYRIMCSVFHPPCMLIFLV